MNSVTDVATRNHPENVAPIKRQKYQRKNLSKMGAENAQKTAEYATITAEEKNDSNQEHAR